ncbi:MAG: hypothetical protein O2942_09310 [Proteobacteria bacterium]|nr:hypothetical protein [Pseudomonadota bacterium]
MLYSTKRYSEFKQYIGNNIRIHREDNGLTQEALAKASYLTTAEIITLEGGKEDQMLNAVLKVSYGLEIEPYMLLDDIYGEDENGKRICLSHFSAYDDNLSKEEKQKIYDEMVASGKYTPPHKR